MERRELKLLENIFNTIDQGLRIVLLEGDEGVGKSDILKNFCKKVNDYNEVCSLFPMLEIKENYLSVFKDTFIKNVKKYFPPERLNILENLGKNIEEDQKFLYHVSLISSLKRVVLIFDDVEFAPATFFNIIFYISSNYGDKKLMVVLAYDPLKQTNDLKEFLKRTIEIKENVLSKIKVEPISIQDLSDILVENGYHIPRFVVEKIYQSSKGNLKMVYEILNYFKINKLIDSDGFWVGSYEDVPNVESQSIKSFFHSIYDNLNDMEKRILTTCSVIGESFTLNELIAIETIPEEELYNILDKFLKLGIIEEYEENKFRFRRREFRDILYNEEISNLKKRYLHGKLAEYYEKINADPYVIGINYYLAKNYDKAIKYLEIAAMNAYKSYRYKDAIEIFNKLFEMKEDYSNYLVVGDCYFKIGNFTEAKKFFEKALLTNKIDAMLRIAELEYTLGNLIDAENILKNLENENMTNEQKFYFYYIYGAIYERRFNFTDAERNYEIALHIALELNRDDYLALIYKQIGVMYYYRGNFQLAEKMYQKSLDHYSKISDYEGMARIYNDLALIETGRNFRKTLNYYELSLSYANLSGNIYLLIILNYNIAQIYFWNSYVKEADKSIESARNLSEMINEYDIRHSIFSFLSDVEKIKGNFKEALSTIDRAITFSEKMNSTFYMYYYTIKKYEILTILGEDIPLEKINEIIEKMKEYNPDLYEAYALGSYSKIFIYKGDIDKAIEYALRAVNKSKTLIPFVDYVDVYGNIPFMYAIKNDFEQFKNSYNELKELSDKMEGDLIHLRIYSPCINGKFDEIEKFFIENNLKFLLFKMYLCYYNFKKDEISKTKLLNLAKDLGINIEKLLKI